MTVYSKTFAPGCRSEVTVYAGPRHELLIIAREYAAGQHGARASELPYFPRVVEGLAAGDITAGTDRVRFWCDSPDGQPFRGPKQYRPAR